MRIYTVHLGLERANRERDIRFVKEGFSWPAFVFSLFWALAKGMWVTAVLIFLAQAAINGVIASARLSPEVQSVLSFAFFVLLGAFGNDFVRLELARKGYREVGVIAAANIAAAERRAFERIPALGAA